MDHHEEAPKGFRFVRIFSIYLTWLLLKTPLTPNAITVLGIVFSIFSGIAYAFNEIICGSVLLIFAILADFSDGEVSRYRQMTSKQGSYLDKLHHIVILPTFFAGITLGLFEISDNKLVLYFGMVATLCSFILPFVVVYGVHVVLLKHVLRYLKTGVVSTNKLEHSEVNNPERSSIYGIVKKLFLTLTKYYDFPYVFYVFGGVLFLDFMYQKVIDPDAFGLGRLLFIELYGFTYPVVVIVYLHRVLSARIIDKTLDEIISDINVSNIKNKSC